MRGVSTPHAGGGSEATISPPLSRQGCVIASPIHLAVLEWMSDDRMTRTALFTCILALSSTASFASEPQAEHGSYDVIGRQMPTLATGVPASRTRWTWFRLGWHGTGYDVSSPVRFLPLDALDHAQSQFQLGEMEATVAVLRRSAGKSSSPCRHRPSRISRTGLRTAIRPRSERSKPPASS